MALKDSKRIVLAALRVALRPLVRLAMRNTFKLMDLFELLKVVFVDVATEELRSVGDAASTSRISVMSGVHRRDAARILKSSEPVRESQDLIARVIGQWSTDPKFSTKSGKPRVLTAEGMESEFAQLVQAVSVDVAPYTVLYEMERTGRCERTPHGVKLCSQLFVIPKGDIEAGYSMLGEDVSDLISAVEANVFDDTELQNLHLKTEFNNIDPKALPEIRQWLLTQGSDFHKRVEQYLASFDRDIHQTRRQVQNPARVSFGSFSFIDESGKGKKVK